MDLYFVLAALFSIATAAPEKRCRGIYFGDKYYDIEIIKDGIGMNQMVINKQTNTVYFVFDQMAEVPTKELGYVNIDTGAAGVIGGIVNASSVAIDEYNTVYVGGDEGIFIISDKDEPEKIPTVNEAVKSVFYKNGLYFTNYRNAAKKVQREYVVPVPELHERVVENIVLDDDNNILFINDKLLRRVKIGTLLINTHEQFKIKYITTDITYKAYIVTEDGIYAYDKYRYKFDKVSNLNNIDALTFNKDNEPVYSSLGYLVRLKYNNMACHE